MIELMIGIGVLVAIVVFSWWGKDDRSKNVCKEQPPGDIFRALGAVLQSDKESEDGELHNYLVEYQGGFFNFVFRRNSQWVNIQYFNFKECAHEHLHRAYTAANGVHLRQSAWNCTIARGVPREDGTPTITANLDYMFSSVGDLEQMKEELRILLSHAFILAREFTVELDKAIKESEEKDAVYFNNVTFDHKLQTLSRQIETRSLYEEQDEKADDASRFSVSRLVQLYDNTDFGCLLSMKIMHGDRVERITDISTIIAFNVSDYIRQNAEPTSLNSIVLTYEFEHQELFVNLTKAKGSTEGTLYYVVNVVRSGSELDKSMENRTPYCTRSMLEVRLTDEDKSAWEVKFMLDDAMDKVQNGREDELTDEQRIAVAHTDPSIRNDLYWGKKYFNNSCYYQALCHFYRVYRVFKIKPFIEVDENFKSLFYDVCYYIGIIYAHLNMNERASYYLEIAKESNCIQHIEDYIGCLCRMSDIKAYDYVIAYIKDVHEKMKEDEDNVERLMPMFQFLQRCYLYLLIEYHKWDEAETQANYMIKNDMDVEFAQNRLEHIHQMREEDDNNK